MGKEEIPMIPFMGADDISNSTTLNDIADFIKPQDKIPLLLALSLYSTPRQSLEGYELIPNTYHPRYAAWFNKATGSFASSLTGMTIVGLRGTSPTSKYGLHDLQDDKVTGPPPRY